jgi:hypothetical protein
VFLLISYQPVSMNAVNMTASLSCLGIGKMNSLANLPYDRAKDFHSNFLYINQLICIKTAEYKVNKGLSISALYMVILYLGGYLKKIFTFS